MNEAELDELLDTWKAPAAPPSLRRGLVAGFPVPRHRRVFGVPLRWALVTAGVALCAALGAGTFDSSQLGRSYTRWDTADGTLYMHSVRVIVPPVSPFKRWSLGYGISGGGGSTLSGASYLYDHRAGKYAGYEYTLELIASGRFRVSLSPMPLSTLRKRLGPFKMNGPLAIPPGLPSSRTVDAGEPFEVTLWESGGERIYERIVLSRTPPQDWPGAQLQSTADGGMRLAGPQLYVNGQLAATQRSAGYGPVIWVHLPGQGRFLVALDPQGNSRFTQAGHVNGNVIEFQSGDTQFRIVCAKPVVEGGDRPVFVYHQQSFENTLDPSKPLAGQTFMGSAGPASLHQE